MVLELKIKPPRLRLPEIMENKQTAVEWFVTQLEGHLLSENIILHLKDTKAYERAKQMEREQIEEAYNAGYRNAEKDLGQWIIAVDISTLSNASDYFTKTYSAPKEGSL